MDHRQMLREIEENHGSPRLIQLERGDLLCSRGDYDTHIYFIEQGCLVAYVTDEEEERIIRFGYQHNILVIMDSFLSGKPTELYVKAIKKTTIKVYSKESFYKYLDQKEENHRFWNMILQDLVLQQMEREIDLLTSSPQERYERVLKRSPQLFQEVPNKYIANYLRMTPETFSRIQKS